MTVCIAVFRSASAKRMLAALPPSSAVNGLRVLPATRRVRADLGRAGEGDLVDARMRDEVIADRGARADHDVEDAVRHARLLQDLRHQQRAQRVSLAGLCTIVLPAMRR